MLGSKEKCSRAMARDAVPTSSGTEEKVSLLLALTAVLSYPTADLAQLLMITSRVVTVLETGGCIIWVNSVHGSPPLLLHALLEAWE